MKKRHAKLAPPAAPPKLSWYLAVLLLCATVVVCWACSEMLLLLQPPCNLDDRAEAAHLQRERDLEMRLGEAFQQLETERRLRSAEHARLTASAAAAVPGSPGAAGVAVLPPAGFQGAQVRSLQAEVARLRSQLHGQPPPPAHERLSSMAENTRPGGVAVADWRPPGVLPGQALRGNVQEAGTSGSSIIDTQLKAFASRGAIAVVVITCKRPQYLQKTMSSLLAASRDPERFPIIISQDDFDAAMTSVISDMYVKPGTAWHMHHAHDAGAKEVAKQFGGTKVSLGYVRIAQHYGFALRRVFDDMGFEQMIFVEEDMEVAPDFFSYFKAMLPILQSDPSLYCVSAWNDNGDATLVHDNKAAFRTDFFPGLGWMLQKDFWMEVRERWAVAYWDEFMRRSDVRKDRKCIRPEVSRSFTFGEKGTSSGQFYKTHLSRVRLNDQMVDWSALDLSFLASADAFDRWLEGQIRSATPTSIAQVDVKTGRGQALRIEYDDAHDYKQVVAKKFGLMDDEKEGIRRMSYHGVIPFSWQGTRVFLHTRQWPSPLDSAN